MIRNCYTKCNSACPTVEEMLNVLQIKKRHVQDRFIWRLKVIIWAVFDEDIRKKSWKGWGANASVLEFPCGMLDYRYHLAANWGALILAKNWKIPPIKNRHVLEVVNKIFYLRSWFVWNSLRSTNELVIRILGTHVLLNGKKCRQAASNCMLISAAINVSQLSLLLNKSARNWGSSSEVSCFFVW